jgi:outer membrane protein assembly factor BamB
VTKGAPRGASKARRRSGLVAATAAALLILPFGGSTGVAAGLTVTSMSPTSGAVGTAVTITGTGLRGNDTVAFHGTAAGSVKANAAGTQLNTAVPTFATSGVVTVTDPATGQRASAPTPFRVTPGISASPGRIWPGGHLTLSGSALSPDRSEPIFISNTRVGTAVTDRNGNFQVGVSVPWSLMSGERSISVVDPNLGRILTILFVVGDWPEFRHDTAHTGVDGFETAIGIANVSKLGLKWGYPTGGAVISSPAVANGIVYVGSNDGSLYALSTATGKLRWSYATGGPITSSPAVTDNRVFVYSSGGVFYALNATTGQLLWKRSIGADSDSSPVTAGDNVYVGTYYDGNLYAFNQATGSMLWNYPTRGALDSPAVANGIVYVGSQDGHVYAVNASTGAKVWTRSTGPIVGSSPAVASGQVYVGTNDGTVYELSASNGTVTHSATPDGSPIRTSPAVGGGLVYVGTDYGRTYALNPTTLAVKWQAPTGFSLRSSPALANGVLYIGGGDYWHMYGFNAASGAVLWDNYTGADIWSSPAIANGRVYVGSYDQYIYAFGL